MDRDEARRVVEDELKSEIRKGYEELRTAAPYPAGMRRILKFIKRRKWETPKGHYVTRTMRGQSGATYYVEREVDWDADYEGALRVWIYVHDGDPDTVERPEYATDLVFQ